MDEPKIDWDDESVILLTLMRIEAKLDEFLRLLGDDVGEEEEPDA